MNEQQAEILSLDFGLGFRNGNSIFLHEAFLTIYGGF